MRILTNSEELILLKPNHVIETVDYEALLDYGLSEQYDVLVVDIDTEDSEGVYTPRVMRREGLNMPIIGMSEDLYIVEEWSSYCADFLNQGGDYLLRAPVNPKELHACMNVVYRRMSGASLNIVYLCEKRLKINITNRSVIFDGMPIHFTIQEMKVVLHLASNMNMLQSKAQLISALYRNEVDEAEIKIVDVFICKARKKLDKAGLKGGYKELSRVIETVWGRGYRMHDIKEGAEQSATEEVAA